MEIVIWNTQNPAERVSLIEKAEKTDWDAGKWLCSLMAEDAVERTFGDGAVVLMLKDGENVASYCTLAPQDEIDDLSMTPWVGFVYTFPAYRGRRCAGLLIAEAEKLAKEKGYDTLYVSSEEKGLYEKYGFTFLKDADSVHGYKTQIFTKKIG